MTHHAVNFQEIIRDALQAHALQFGMIDEDRLSTLRPVSPQNFGSERLIIEDDAINNLSARVLTNGPDVVTECVTKRFAGLRHQVGDVDARRTGPFDGLGDTRNEQIGDNAGEK